ncbi:MULTISPECIES: branched-chain amino acid ABC transporter substrate-binding protein [unclassified Duganella]|uniref:branched-chain amino acid ABC transporter substrate-binding protein n=1 Tax=unclassified Duganella TaxID=2636909 RepID=UPI00088720F5|nr:MULTISPECIES: branched-chain amino acid ABC transporter substrate-binding protein [unclassified Duganella]SDF38123.1 branched-chain amino acid transport system substrate-binding protein [Duganella sp. OV458]SDI88224.1 amino acid/amide ABC transporter substrate-binding protein, HAAT family [Duganella sp. OV510]
MRRTPPFVLLLLTLASAQAQTVVKIGAAAPYSGQSAHQGKDIENGAQMAIDDLNAKGVTIDGKKVQWVLLAEDDGSDPKQGTAVAQKLVDAGVAGVVGHLNSGTTVPASKIYHSAGVPQISPAATTPLYTHQGFETAFRVVANDNLVGRVLARYTVATLKASKIAVIDDRTAFGQGLADEFVKGVKSTGGAQIVSRQFTSDKAVDFNAILTQIRAHKPDVVFYGGMDAVAGPMLKQMKALGITARLVSGDGICSEKMPILAGDALGDDKVICVVAGGIDKQQQPAYDAFAARYQQRYKLSLQTYAPYAYDAVMVLASAMQQARSADPARYLPALANVRYQGITGTISFDANGDLRNAALTLFTYRHGKKTSLQVVR